MGLVVFILTIIMGIYDIISYPFYWISNSPGSKLKESKRVKAKPVSESKGSITYRSHVPRCDFHKTLVNEKLDTLEKVFRHAVKKNSTKRCLGTREIKGESEEKQPDGKVFQKLELGGYKWKTYNDVDKFGGLFSAGLERLGLSSGDRIALFAETRAEWLLSAIAAFRVNLTVVTLYATLGDDAVAHGLNETEVEYVITSYDLLPKFKDILNQTPKVKHIIYMEDQLHKASRSGFKEDVEIHSFNDIIAEGKKSNRRESIVHDINENEGSSKRPGTKDVAIIMYTSGSTGTPKGVLLTHQNVTTAMGSFADALGKVNSSDVYIGFLPLAHVLELMCETICFSYGIPIGYSTPLTIIDSSSKIKTGARGDAGVLSPTIMASVPLMLERIYKGINDKVKQANSTEKFNYFYEYKLKWNQRGFETPLTDKIAFGKVRSLVGGKLRLMASGGSALAPDTQEFIRTCMCCPLLQGYGLTETAACATVSLPSDLTVGRVGPPLGCCDIRIVDWEEGNYKVTDKPYPRGEVLIGGDNISIGYYKLPEKTDEDFFVEGEKRWFRTGDIAQVHPDGSLQIIDRKKDLLKLQQGEYISLGKVESVLKLCPFVENICVYGDSTKNNVIALITPAEKALHDLAKKKGKNISDWATLCKDKELTSEVLKSIMIQGKAQKLNKFEIPAAVTLVKEMWTPETDLVTAAFKLKRKNLQNFYQKEIDEMYANF